MIKIFRGGRGGDTFKTPPPCEQLLPLPIPCFKMFLERSLNDPTTPLQASFTATPSPSTTPPPPPKNFDHTLTISVLFFIISVLRCFVFFTGFLKINTPGVGFSTIFLPRGSGVRPGEWSGLELTDTLI